VTSGRTPRVAGVLACLVLLAGCSGLESTGDKGFITAAGTVREVAVDDRGDAITLGGEGLDGEQLDLADWHGKPVVVVVWGSWCTPCRDEAPEVVAAADQLGAAAQFVGVNIRNNSTADSQAFVRRWEIPYPSFYSPTGEALLAFSGTLSANSIPSFVVLDADGRVAASIIGRLPSTTTLVQLVEGVEGAESETTRG
jgi:thiol-disulfide isomerase/thioredoxin